MKPNNVQRALMRARDLIRKGWTQGSAARDKEGRAVFCNDPKAVCFCALGALGRATLRNSVKTRFKCNGALHDATCTSGLANWNDDPGQTKGNVLRAFTKAIRLAGKL